MSFREDLIFITTNGIDLSILEEDDDDLLDELVEYLLEELPSNMYAFKDNKRVSYDNNNVDGCICAHLERHPENASLRRVVFLKEKNEIYSKEKAGEFIIKTANFFGQKLTERLSKK